MRFKKLRAIYICMMFIAVLTSCAFGKRKQKIAEELLSKKYGEEFVVTSYNGHGGIAGDYYTVTAYAKSCPQIPFEANVSRDETFVSDSYVSRKVCLSISNVIANNISALPCKYYVNTGIMSRDSVCSDPNVSIEEFVSKWEPNNRFYVYLYLSDKVDRGDAGNKAVYEAIKEAMKGLPDIDGNLSVYVSKDSTIKKVREYAETNAGLYGDYFKLAQDDYRGQFEFDDSVLVFTIQDAEMILGH